jgi:uncharacterized membrane-anchored protein YhcB (DUF1043 family)
MEIIYLIIGLVIGVIAGFYAHRYFYGQRAVNKLRAELDASKAHQDELISQLAEAKRGRAVITTYQNEAERTKAEAGKARDAVMEAHSTIADLKARLDDSEKLRMAAATAAHDEIASLKAQLQNIIKTREASEEVARLKAELAGADKIHAAHEEISRLKAILAQTRSPKSNRKKRRGKVVARKTRRKLSATYH